MKIPTPLNIKKQFKLSKREAETLKLGQCLVGLEIERWNSLEKLAHHAFTLKRKNAQVTAEWSLTTYRTTLSNISKKFLRNNNLRKFAAKLKLYLEDKSTISSYKSIFNHLNLEKENEDADRMMKLIADINAKKLTFIAGNRLKRSLDDVCENDENSSPAIINDDCYV